MSGMNGALVEDIKPDYSGVPGPALDSVRMRLAQLTHSLRRIRDDLSRADLTQWYSLQSQINVTLSQLMSVTSTLQHFEDTLDSTIVYPLPKFPTTSHESLLTTLLRKKNIPEVEEWIKDAIEASGVDTNMMRDDEIEKILEKNNEDSKWALEVFAKEFEKRESNGDTADDLDVLGNALKPVKTSVRQRAQSPFQVEDILKYMSRGEVDRGSSSQEGLSTNNEQSGDKDIIMAD